MFSGKTKTLIKRIVQLRTDGFTVAVFAPRLDTRSPNGRIRSHDNQVIKATPVDNPQAIVQQVSEQDDFVAIDETQFFDESIVDVCLNLVADGKHVLVSGLDLDFRGMPFGPMPQLLACAEVVHKMWANCVVCGEPAYFSQRLLDGRPATFYEKVVVIGGAELYEPRCRKHHEVPARPITMRRMVWQAHREEPDWQLLDWVQRLQAIGRNGLNFGDKTFDRERYGEVLEVANEMIVAMGESRRFGKQLPIEIDQPESIRFDEGYMTPKIAVAMAVFDPDDSLLLVQRADDESWMLPGGWADVGFIPAENAIRELYQETGLHASCEGIIGVYDVRLNLKTYAGLPAYTIVFYGQIVGGKLNLHRQEVLDARFFPVSSTSRLQLGSPAQVNDAVDFHTSIQPARYDRPSPRNDKKLSL